VTIRSEQHQTQGTVFRTSGSQPGATTWQEISLETHAVFIPGLCHHGGCLHKQLHLVVCVVSSSVRNIIQYICTRKLIPVKETNLVLFPTVRCAVVLNAVLIWSDLWYQNSMQIRTTSLQLFYGWFCLTDYLSATASNRSGLNVPSESMYRHLPSPPPISTGNWKIGVINLFLSHRFDTE